MSFDNNLNVEIATCHVSLAELEANLPRFNSSADEAAPTEPQQPQGEDLVVVSVPSVEKTDRETMRIGKPDTRLQRLPQKTTPVPFVQQLKEFTRGNASGLAPEVKDVNPSVGDVALPSLDAKLGQSVEKASGLNCSIAGAPKADMSEKPADWLPDRDQGEKRSSKKAKPLDTPKQAFSELTDTVLQQFPLGPCSVLLVADADGHSCGESVAYQLALQLAEKKVGKVLLVDSHFEQRKLSERLALGFEIGLADLLSTNKTIDETLCETECSNLDFLPVGTDRMCKRRSPDSTWLADNILTLKDEYQFVIVSVGNVFHRSTEMWGRHCDASYMAIEMNTTNQTIAQSGVVRLQQFNARLLGCVVTDAAA
jgi:Mrp family chromosome partitioning ATPase